MTIRVNKACFDGVTRSQDFQVLQNKVPKNLTDDEYHRRFNNIEKALHYEVDNFMNSFNNQAKYIDQPIGGAPNPASKWYGWRMGHFLEIFAKLMKTMAGTSEPISSRVKDAVVNFLKDNYQGFQKLMLDITKVAADAMNEDGKVPSTRS